MDASANILTPTEQVYRIYPSQLSAVGWDNVQGLTFQSVHEDALAQSFQSTNVASLGVGSGYSNTTEQIPTSPPAEAIPSIESEIDNPSNTNTNTNTDTEGEDQLIETPAEIPTEANVSIQENNALDAVENDVQQNPDATENEGMSVPEAETEGVEVDTQDTVSRPWLQFVKEFLTFIPAFAQETETVDTNTTTVVQEEVVTESVDEEEIIISNEEVATDSVPEEVVNTENETVEEDIISDEESSVSTIETTSEAEELDTVDTPDVAAGELDEAQNSTNSQTSSTETNQTQTESAGTISAANQVISDNKITLSGFGLPDLAPGEVIDNVQLRLSLAAFIDEGMVEALPTLRASYQFDTFKGVAGSILLQGEVSNALNGGYYLLALPTLDDASLFDDLVITIEFVGDVSAVDYLYIDSAWIEVVTESFTKEQLDQRKQNHRLNHLSSPQLSELVSTQLNFGRYEDPVFNLRYKSQRNFVVNAVRNLFNRDKVRLSDVRIVHRDLGDIGIEPETTVTADGLITFQFLPEDRERLRPGSYSVEVVYDEGGKTFTDSFDFQWGLLAINTKQSEYLPNEQVQISIGSLSPNGNTVCNADLRLYITSPDNAVTQVPVTESGLCDGNNVIDVPDYSALYSTHVPGSYELYLERLDEQNEVIAYTTDTFLVAESQTVVIERVGPTRIYPVAPYTMEMKVRAVSESFSGQLVERVPLSFEIIEAGAAEVRRLSTHQELIWPITIRAGGEQLVTYTFDAPNISPYLFELGPARLDTPSSRQSPEPVEQSPTDVELSVPNEETGVSVEESLDSVNVTEEEVSSSSSEDVESNSESAEIIMQPVDERRLASNTSEDVVVFTEHRSWQIASDAVGNMVLYWTDGAAIPADWTCLSCGSGTFFERFAMGSSTYNTTGGSLTHTHTAAVTSVAQTLSAGIIENRSGTTIAANDHSHTVTPTIGTANNLPEYRTLRVIQYTGGAGEPPTIPAGAIAIFDAAVPTGWTRYSAHDGFYVYGADTIGTTGGSNTHTHTLSGTLSTPGGATLGRRGGGTQLDVAGVNHTHSFSVSSPAASNEPPYIEVILGEIDADGPPPVGMISMWTEDVPAGWIDVSTDGASPFSGRFIKASTTYGATGGSLTHTQPDATGITAAIATTDTQSGQSASPGFGSPITHSHSVDITGFSEESHLPPYLTVVYGKRIGLDATYTQSNFRWYENINAETPTTPWNSVVEENEVITLATNPVESGDVVRLRINAEIANATSSLGDLVKLQYAAASECSAATGWADVGTAGSGTIWRGFDNASVSDGLTLSTTLLASSTDSFTYEENGASAGTPTEVAAGDFGEWDFVIQNNGAAAGTEYCFRLVFDDNSLFFAYPTYPQLITNAAPTNYQLTKRFDNENASSTLPTFDFYAADPEADKIDYQIQIASDFAFSSIVIDRNSVSNSTQFENQVLTSEKNPFTSGQTVRFTNVSALTNGETYWWRVRGRDPNGSNEWGEWSNQNSFTVTTSLLASGWLQREDEQFERGVFTGVEVYGSDQVRLITGSSTGTIVSPTIDFQAGEEGTAWNQLRFSDDTTNGSIIYQVEYRNEAGEWSLISDSDLPSNSTGFSASPVNLLGLDVGTYRFIRIVATLTDSGGTPFLQDWAVDWGFRVETPSIESPFPNEKVGTTTPTFTFTTSDPQNDDLTYQIEWSTDATFGTGVTTRTSDTDTGFINLDDGADTDPFGSGDTILYTVQAADALTDGTTYWWRVRAKDTTGDNEYSFWTEPRSLTVDGTVVASTWFQTTQAQFESNILSGTTGVTGGVSVSTVASEALIVYGEGTATTPRYRLWNGTNWGSEGNLVDINSSTRWVVTQAATTREEYVAATIGSNGHVVAQVFAVGEWDNDQTMTTTVGSTAARGFDVAYETVSGRAIVAYCDGDANPSYRIWNGTSWSAETTITSALTSDCRWVEMASDPTSDEIVMVIRGVDAAPYEALVWDGTTWGNSSTFGGARVATYSGIALEYEESGDQAVAVAPSPAGGPNRMVYNTWNGTTWSGETTQTIGGRLYWGQLAQNRGTDELALCYIGDGNDVRSIRWTGAAWVGDTQFIATANAVTDPAFSCVFENGGGRDNYIVGAYSGTTATNYRTWNTTAWSAEAQVNSIIQSATMQLIRTDNDNILGTFFDYTNNSLRFSAWNGTTWSTTQTLEDSVSVTSSAYGYPYWMAPRNPGSAGTVVVAPPVEFTDGLGPYWQDFSWNETTPGTSAITYQLQYFNGSTWQFIPDADLPGNESGFTAGPVDLSALNVSTYGTIRPFASLQCDGASNCPTLDDWTVTWAEGITVSGTLQEYDQATNVGAGSVAVAVNGTLQIGKTGSISAGTWSIDNVTVFPGDIVTVFVSGAADANEAVGVARYNGIGDMTGFELYERHLSLGSASATSTPITNTDIGEYTVTNTEDVFFSVSTGTLQACADTGCGDVRLFIKANNTYQPAGRIITHDIDVQGTLIAGAFTHDVGGSWLSTGTTTMTGSTVVMTATTGTETIATAGTVTPVFANLRFGTTTGTATWELQNSLETTGNLTVERGTLNRQTEEIIVRGTLSTEANGLWSGIGTTTFAGSGSSNWRDLNSSLQNVGHVVIEGSAKTVILTGNVAAESITIGADDVLDASASNFGITVFGNWVNNNSFVPRQGTVTFASSVLSREITHGGSNFYNLVFNGSGSWSFTQSTVLINNDFTISDGTVTLPTATTTVGGSWNSTGGTFAHNNGEVRFTANSAKNITVDGGAFNNNFYDLLFTGSGSWAFTDAATTTQNVRFNNGTVTLPASTFAVGDSWLADGGSYNSNNGTVNFYGSATHTITPSSNFSNLLFSGSGSWSFTTADVVATADLTVGSGTLTLPTTTLTIGGSYTNTGTVDAGTSEVIFDANTTGHSIDFGSSSLYDVRFNNVNGGWTIVSHATTSRNVVLENANAWTLASGQTLAVGGQFTNSVGGSATTWTGSTLALLSGTYTVNSKSDAGDIYDTIRIATGVDISWWNSLATTYDLIGNASLYSQDHNAVDGDLYIFGNYTRSTSSEYWSYATDFDGTDLSGGNERPVQVRMASGSVVSLDGSVWEVLGSAGATTTIANQGSGTYTITMNGGTTTAQFYDFNHLGATGISLLDGVIVNSLNDGRFIPTLSGASALSIASSTIEANPALQIFRTEFSTTSAISATNVSLVGASASSYWWFRNGTGNLYGEVFDNDDGDPGAVRWDDSSLVITVSGTVYDSDTVTPLTSATCDGSTAVVTVVVNGTDSYTGSCSGVDGSYSVSGVVVVGDPVLTIYLDNAPAGEQAVAVTRTPSGDITDLDLYVRRVILRHEDTTPLSIANLTTYTNDDDGDVLFTAATGTPNSLTTNINTELYIWPNKTFDSEGEVTLQANALSNSYDGTLYLAASSTFIGFATSTYTIGGRLVLQAGAEFVPASSTVLMNATTTGKSITANAPLSLHELIFDGIGGAWHLTGDITTSGSILADAGTVTGTADITIPNGSFTGSGTVSLGGGTVTMGGVNSVGGVTPWTFANLTLGTGAIIGTTTSLFSTTTISETLTIANAHFLEAGSSVFDLSGSGSVFVGPGTFIPQTSTVRYSGAAADVASRTYHNLYVDAGVGTGVYTATGAGIVVNQTLLIGETNTSTLRLDTNDVALSLVGDMTIAASGSLTASPAGLLAVSGDWNNSGTFNANGGTVTFETAATTNINAGSSEFSSVLVDATGDVTVVANATATNAWTLLDHNQFTVASSQTLAVGGTFTNTLGGGATTWTDSILALYGNGNYQINAKTVNDTYGTLEVRDITQIRMWNSDAQFYNIDATGSLYSQDHENVDGDLYVFGSYNNTSRVDHWSYETDFDGVVLGSGETRKVDVQIAENSSVEVGSGGALNVIGTSSASSTITNQGSGTYSLSVTGGTTNWSYYEVRNIDIDGLQLSGTPSVVSLAQGDIELALTGGTGMTVAGSVITANPAKTFTNNRFALGAAGSGFNVTVTGSTVSSWRFTNHYGDIAGEAFDSDPDGDPGYAVWDDSAALISVSGRVYSDEGATVSAVCDDSTNVITLRMAGLTSYQSSCDSTTGQFTITNVAYSPGDSFVAYIDDQTPKGATVSAAPISSISNFDIYENRVIVRHEGVDPLTNSQIGAWDSSDDVDVPFTVTSGDLSLPANRKLLIWNDKQFAPAGDVTVSGGGVGAAYDGTFELLNGATFAAGTSSVYSIGGSLLTAGTATIIPNTAEFRFTTSGSGRTVDTNEAELYNVVFNGAGSWIVDQSSFSILNDLTFTNGSVTLPTGTTTVAASLQTTSGTFDANDGILRFDGAGSGNVITFGSSTVNELQFVGGGSWSMNDTNATSTGSLQVIEGSVTLPSGQMVVGADLRVATTSTLLANNGELIFTNATSGVIETGGSDLAAVTINGAGTFSLTEQSVTFLSDLTINDGILDATASGSATNTVAVGGSFVAVDDSFIVATTTVLLNAASGSHTINPGNNSFYNLQFGAPSGSYTVTNAATTTNNLAINSVSNLIVNPGVRVYVGGIFTNLVGGSATNWNGSTLVLDGAIGYTINTKSSGGDEYGTLEIGANSAIRSWNSQATSTAVASSSSWYSMNHGAIAGDLNIYGDFVIATTTEYWSYDTNFDGEDLTGGSERAVTVRHAENATTTLLSGTLRLLGANTNETTVTNQGSGTYSFSVAGGTLQASDYIFRNLDITGVNITGTPLITSLTAGDFEVGIDNGTAISITAEALTNNASLVITGTRFATTTAITGTNVTLTGTTSSAWNFTGHTGNLAGEAYDVDGIDACGSIRWDNSECLLVQQTQYRWRLDDGGEGATNSEWYDTDWDSRQRVRVVNSDTSSYTNAVIKLDIDSDVLMRSDFADLRFTADDGVTLLDHYIETFTVNTDAVVWVKIPTLAAQSTEQIYMYFGNASASDSSTTTTFAFAENFESGSLPGAYTGDTSLFGVTTDFNYERTYGLDNPGNESGRATDGIFRTDVSVAQGQKLRYFQYVDTADGSGDEVCTLFAVQSPGTDNNNYGVCLEQFGTDRISLVRDVVDTDASGTMLSSSTVTYATGWYEVEIDWQTNGDISVTLRKDGVTEATVSANDSTYVSGGVGFTYWFNHGGWDLYTARTRLETEPTYFVGATQSRNGATWAAAQNTPSSAFNLGDRARLRVAVENSGLAIENQQFLLEYAERGSAPSCEAVIGSDFSAVPPQASCGTSPVCMQTSTEVTNGQSTTDHLENTRGGFVAGQVRMSPDNKTTDIDLPQDTYTELEYVITPTVNTTDDNLCFRVTNNGTALDTYQRVAALQLQFDPVVQTDVLLNNGSDISLSAGTTTRIFSTATVIDGNGFADIDKATSTVYRGGVGAACTPNDNNCYVASSEAGSCSFVDCTGNECTVSCYTDIIFHADPTDFGTFEGQEWFAFIEVEDASGGYGFGSVLEGVEVETLRALSIDGTINYGSLEPNQNTGSFNPSVQIENFGNVEFSIDVIGTDLVSGGSSVIPAEFQRIATSTFDYNACIGCESVSSTSPVPVDVLLEKPVVDTPPVTAPVYWGIAVPLSIQSVLHQGVNTITPVSP